MLWLELGKEIARVGAPLLGAVVAGTPAASILEPICYALGQLPPETVPTAQNTDPAKLQAALAADPLAGDKMQQIEADHNEVLKQAADTAAVSVINKLLQ